MITIVTNKLWPCCSVVYISEPLSSNRRIFELCERNIADGETENKTLEDKIFRRTVIPTKISSNLFEIQSKEEIKTVMYYSLPGGKYMLLYLQIN